jgi:pilus assembly protein CpaB
MRRTLLLIAAVLVAALGTSLVYLYAHGADRRALDGQEPRAVLVATTTLAENTPAARLNVTVRQLPEIAVVEGAITSLREVSGKVLTVTVVPGAQLSSAMFATRPPKVPVGQSAVSVEIQDVNRVPALLGAGDTVQVFAQHGARLERLLDHPVQVFQVGGKDVVSGNDLSPTIVTFLVPSADALALAESQAHGDRLVLILVSG